jgi:hypothetical protein
MKEENMKLATKLRDETGAATAEYAIATMAPVTVSTSEGTTASGHPTCCLGV